MKFEGLVSYILLTNCCSGLSHSMTWTLWIVSALLQSHSQIVQMGFGEQVILDGEPRTKFEAWTNWTFFGRHGWFRFTSSGLLELQSCPFFFSSGVLKPDLNDSFLQANFPSQR